MHAPLIDFGTGREDDRNSLRDCPMQIRRSIIVTPGRDLHTAVEEEPGRTSEPRKESVAGQVNRHRSATQAASASRVPGRRFAPRTPRLPASPCSFNRRPARAEAQQLAALLVLTRRGDPRT